jgi:hypothetical protein
VLSDEIQTSVLEQHFEHIASIFRAEEKSEQKKKLYETVSKQLFLMPAS